MWNEITYTFPNQKTITETSFVCINHVFLKFNTRFLLISLSMIYTNEADLHYDTKWQNTSQWVTPSCHFVSALKLLSGDRSQIFYDASNELLNTHELLIDSQCNYGYAGSCGKFGRQKTHYCRLSCESESESYIQVTILVCFDAKPFPANQNIEYQCFHCAFHIYHSLAGSVPGVGL